MDSRPAAGLRLFLATALHGLLTMLLLLAGAVIMRINRVPIIGYGQDARLQRSRRRVVRASGPP